MVEPAECIVEGVERAGGEHVLMRNVTKVQECCESLSDIDRDKSLQRRDEDLFKLRTRVESSFGELAFINALESFPVHCWKFRPCLNLRRPGNRGTRAILRVDEERLKD